jgi:Domain of unknown function (DUF4412)
MKRTILMITLVMVCMTFLHADIFVKTNQHSYAYEFKGQKIPAKDEVTYQWIAKGKYASIGKAKSTVVDKAKNKLFIIYHASKTYVEADLPIKISSIIPDSMKAKMAKYKVSARVNPTGATKKIGSWNCSAYLIVLQMSTGKVSMNTWTTNDVSFDVKTLARDLLVPVMHSTMPGLDEVGAAELKKISGFQIRSRVAMDMLGAKRRSKSDVVEISEKEPPPNTYAVPAGYKKQDKLNIR